MAFLMKTRTYTQVSFLMLLGLLLLSLCSNIEAKAYSRLKNTALMVSGNASSGATSALLIVSGNMVGVGATNPSSKLSVSTVNADLSGTAFSSTFRINWGPLSTTSGNEMSLASFGFLSGNESVLGIRAIRTSAGSDWTTSAIGIGMDVDNTIRAGASIYLHGNGNVGIGISAPQYTLHVNGTFKNSRWKATEVMSNVSASGGSPVLSTNTFTTSGGTLKIFASCSAYSGSATRIYERVYIMDSAGTTTIESLGTMTTYTNQTSSHKAFPPQTFIVTDIPAGTYKIKFISGNNTIIDANDYFNCTVLEMPF